MKYNSSLNKLAWAIRRKAASKFNCPVLEVSWKHCIDKAKRSKRVATTSCKVCGCTLIGPKVLNLDLCTACEDKGIDEKARRFKRVCMDEVAYTAPFPKKRIRRAGRRIDRLQPKCIDEIQRVVNFFSKKHGVDIPMPEIIDFKKRGKAAGRCWPNRISLNNALLLQERENFISRTPGHEAVHYCEYFLFGESSHGSRWQIMMKQAGLEPNRCHKYNTDNVGVKKPFIYYCDCRSHKLSFIQHERAQNRGYYWCRACKSTMIWGGEKI